jgi:hypothetical protein
MAKVLPIVRLLAACEDMIIEGKQISLLRLILNIRSYEVPPYPVLVREICVFVVLAEARGTGSFFVRIVQSNSNVEVAYSGVHEHSFGSDPLSAHGLPFRLHDCLFPEAGLYSIQFWFEGSLLAEQALNLEQS